MPTQTKILSTIIVAVLTLPACASNLGDPGSSGSGGGNGTGGVSSGSGGTATTGTGGVSPGTGGVSTATGGALGTGGIGPVTATGGSSSGGSVGSGSAGNGAAGAASGGGRAGTMGGATGGTGGMRSFAKVEKTVPAQYANTPTNQGKWTSTTYPCYYHGGGSIGQVIQKQTTPITKAVNIYTPPGYDAQNQYPLIFFLHGFPDNQNTWMDRAKIKPNVLLDNLINAKVIKPIIAVWPMGNSNNDPNNQSGYMVFDNELFGDLIPFLESKYSIKKDRDSRAMSGFSFGGMQTINIFLCHHLKEFGWFAGLSSVGQNSDAIASCLKQQDPAMYPVNYFYLQSGANELATDSVKASADGLTTKAAPTITSANFTYLVTDGGHDYDNCTIGLYNIVRIAFPY